MVCSLCQQGIAGQDIFRTLDCGCAVHLRCLAYRVLDQGESPFGCPNCPNYTQNASNWSFTVELTSSQHQPVGEAAEAAEADVPDNASAVAHSVAEGGAAAAETIPSLPFWYGSSHQIGTTGWIHDMKEKHRAKIAADPEYRSRIQRLKKATTEFNKSHATQSKRTSEAQANFKHDIEPHYNAIRLIRQQAKDDLQNHEAYKNFHAKQKALILLRSAVMKKYHFDNYLLSICCPGADRSFQNRRSYARRTNFQLPMLR